MFAHAASLVVSAPAFQPRAVPANDTVPTSVTQDSALLAPGPVNPLGTAETNSYIPYEWFAQATYCPQPSQADWSCSTYFLSYSLTASVIDIKHPESCQADPVKDFQVYASGGDGGIIQFCEFVLLKINFKSTYSRPITQGMWAGGLRDNP